jgi:hypothetical protein
VGTTEFAVTSRSRSTTCGRDGGEAGQEEPVHGERGQDQDEERQPDVVVGDEDGTRTSRTARTRLLITRVIRRGQRSRKTPTNGPRTEKGSRIVAKPAAMAPAFGARSGEKSTEDTRGDLEDAVRELGQESHREQPAEPAVAQQGAQISEEGHPRRIGERHHPDLGV